MSTEEGQELARQASLKFAGSYRNNRRSYSKWEKFVSFVRGDTNIRLHPEGGLLLADALGKDLRYLPTKQKGVFQNSEDPSGKLVFEMNASDQVTHVFSHSIMSSKRLGALDSIRLHQVVLAFCLVVFLSVVVSFIRRKWKVEELPKNLKLTDLLLFIAALLNVTFVIVFLYPLATREGADIYTSGVAGIGFILTLPVIAVMFAILAALSIFRVWMADMQSRWASARSTLVILVLALFALVLNYWNLLGPWYL